MGWQLLLFIASTIVAWMCMSGDVSDSHTAVETGVYSILVGAVIAGVLTIAVVAIGTVV